MSGIEKTPKLNIFNRTIPFQKYLGRAYGTACWGMASSSHSYSPAS